MRQVLSIELCYISQNTIIEPDSIGFMHPEQNRVDAA